MFSDHGYHCSMHRLTLASVLAFGLLLAPPIYAQINGVPASVSSIGFGGAHFNSPGVPASITSIGPRGIVPNNQFFTQPTCCINPLFPVNPNPPQFQGHHRHQRNLGAVYAVPYAVPYPVAVPVEESAQEDEEEYRGGPTIFDRRGPGEAAYADRYAPPAQQQPVEVASAQPAEPAADQPQTVLIFKDGHQLEVSNYAIVGSTLFDMTEGHRRKVALSELDLAATTKANDDIGLNFQVPQGSAAN